MDRGQIALKLSMESLGLPFSIKTFEERLVLQKAVYLVQAAGVHLGYYYHWYLHGPYSRSLTQDAYGISMELAGGMDESQGWTLGNKSQERLQQIQNLVIGAGSQEERAKRLELLASVHFLIDRGQVPGIDAKKICETLGRFKKTFTEAEVQTAIAELKEYGVLNA